MGLGIWLRLGMERLHGKLEGEAKEYSDLDAVEMGTTTPDAECEACGPSIIKRILRGANVQNDRKVELALHGFISNAFHIATTLIPRLHHT